MGDVLIRYGEDAGETATLLLGAADELGEEPFVVRHQPDDGGFLVPEEVAKKAGLSKQAVDTEAEAAEQQKQALKEAERLQAEAAARDTGDVVGPDQNEPKKTAAKRTTTKKTAAKKTAAKSTGK
jgi:hypothetical protein